MDVSTVYIISSYVMHWGFVMHTMSLEDRLVRRKGPAAKLRTVVIDNEAVDALRSGPWS